MIVLFLADLARRLKQVKRYASSIEFKTFKLFKPLGTFGTI
jgi:hypothetical protein